MQTLLDVRATGPAARLLAELCRALDQVGDDVAYSPGLSDAGRKSLEYEAAAIRAKIATLRMKNFPQTI